jgi:hypothetical protein
VISGSSGSAEGFQVVRPRSPGVIDMFPAKIYASVRWRDRIIEAKTRLQPAQQKTKYLWSNQAQPQLINPTAGDYRPTAGGNVYSITTYALSGIFSGRIVKPANELRPGTPRRLSSRRP